MLRAAVAALGAAQSVHLVGSNLGQESFDARLGRSSAISTDTLTPTGHVWIRVVGCYDYIKTDFGHLAGLWRRYPAHAFPGFTTAEYAQDNPLIGNHGPQGAKVQQATVNGRKVVVVSWLDGSKVQVANTGPAYPLRADFKGQYPVWMVFSEYNVPFDVTAPSNAIDAPRVASRTGRPLPPRPQQCRPAAPGRHATSRPPPPQPATTAHRAAHQPQPRCAARPPRHPRR